MIAEVTLFGALRAEFDHNLQKQKSESDDNLLIFTSNQFNDVVDVLFSKLVKGGFSSFVVGGRTNWNPAHHYYQSVRISASRGAKIHRAFLLPIRTPPHNSTLVDHIRLDKAAGITVSMLYVGDLISSAALPSGPSLEFGIWDDSVVCARSHEPTDRGGRPTEWRITQRPEDLDLYTRLKDLLLTKGTELGEFLQGTKSFVNLEEPVVITAPLARELAPVLCRGSYMCKEDCSWYHAAWQFLRIFNMVSSTPARHAEFYLKELHLCATSRKCPRVLVCGAADYSMLAHVLWAYKQAGATCSVSVIDQCETPLLLCKWYAKYLYVDISTYCNNIFSFETSDKFDIVVTDGFLTRFNETERQKIVRKWNCALRHGGKVITTVQIEPWPDERPFKASAKEVSRFRTRAVYEAKKWREFLEISPGEIAELAQGYAEHFESSN
jgi:hypothetical protein